MGHEEYGKSQGGCGASFAPGQWWHFCGETDMGQTLPVFCTRCGGTYKLANEERRMERQNEGRIEPIDENERQTGGVPTRKQLEAERANLIAQGVPESALLKPTGRTSCAPDEDETSVLPGDGEFVPDVPQLGSREVRDMGKLRYDLIPPDFLEFLARVFGYGAEKYDDNNWMKGLNQSETYACHMRHMQKWWAGENLDEDYTDADGNLVKGSGLPHLWHTLWNVGVMAYFERHRPDLDDRGVNEPRLVEKIFASESDAAFTVEVQLPADGSNEGFIFAQQGDERYTVQQARAVLQALRDDGYHNRVIRIIRTSDRIVKFTDGTQEYDGIMSDVIQAVFPGDPRVTQAATDEFGNSVDADGRLDGCAPHGPSDLYDENGTRGGGA